MNIRTSRIAVLLSAAAIIAVIAAGCAKKPAQDERALMQEGIQSFQAGGVSESPGYVYQGYRS